MIKSSFAAIADARTRLMILGSLPGEVSLAQQRYYAHPRNQFWRLMEAVIEAPLAGSPYPDRLAALRLAGVGLWDVVRSAERAGSLDTHIRGHQPNALADFAATLPCLRAIAFNGGAASRIGRRALAGASTPTLVTPSPPAAPRTPSPSSASWRRGWRSGILLKSHAERPLYLSARQPPFPTIAGLVSGTQAAGARRRHARRGHGETAFLDGRDRRPHDDG